MASKRLRAGHSSANRLSFEKLEHRLLLANDLLPDVFAWESEERGFLHDYVVEGDLLRFSTAFANQGAGHLEVTGGDVLANGNQEVLQRIYDDEGGFRDRVAGEFTYHASHGHIHFDGYAIYSLREIGPAGEVGDVVATGGKISFCLIDITKFDEAAGSSRYGSCGTTQGVSAGWTDVYNRSLADQWINISGVDDGDYYLEVITDPEDKLLESDETNNTTLITVSIVDGPGNNGDRFEANNTFATAANLGMFSERIEPGLSIHTDQDVDYYQFNAVDQGDYSIHVNFSHELGNIDAFVYDSEFNLVASGNSVNDIEDLHFDADPDSPYFLEVISVDGLANGYDLEFDGPGELINTTTSSDDVPIAIPDAGSGPGATVTSTLEGPDVTLTDLNLIFDELRHTYLGDLHFDLTSPSGTTAVIIRSTFESEGGPLGGDNDFVNTFLDDQATTLIGNGSAPFSGSFNPSYGDISNPLSIFNGESALGTWTVSITDWAGSDTGTLHAWSLMFTGVDNNPGDLLEQNDAFPQATDLGIVGAAAHADLTIHNQSDVDFFRFIAQDTTQFAIDLEFIHSDGNLDFVVYDSNQQEIMRAESTDDNESLSLPLVEGELYFIEVYGLNNQTNAYNFSLDSSGVVRGQALFYNDSIWDNNSVDAGTSDGDAIAVGKTALHDGETATFANYSSYIKGINGIIIDVDSFGGDATVDDFQFLVGTTDDTSSWTAAPTPVEIITRAGEGVDGSDRVMLVWDEGAITNTWLQVSVLVTENTGLNEDYVFYYGSVIGDVGNSTTDTFVNGDDIGLVRNNLSGFTSVEIDSRYDIDRNGRVDATDIGVVRNNLSGFSMVPLITPNSGSFKSSASNSKVADIEPDLFKTETLIRADARLENVAVRNRFSTVISKTADLAGSKKDAVRDFAVEDRSDIKIISDRDMVFEELNAEIELLKLSTV